MKTFLILGACAFLATGCANRIPVQPVKLTSIDTLRGQSFALTMRETPMMSPLTIGQGGATRNRPSIADTSSMIAKELAAALQASSGMLAANGSVKADGLVSIQEIASAAKGNATYVLDVQTVNFLVAYFPANWQRYQVQYSAIGRLINTDSGAVVATGTCNDVADNKATAPTYEMMMANDGAILRQKLALEAAACVATLKRDMFQL